jgi:hypothetical protein
MKKKLALGLGALLWLSSAAIALAQEPADYWGYFKSLLQVQWKMTPTQVDEALKAYQVTRDEKHGFIRAGKADAGGGLSEDYTLAAWIKADQSKVFGLAESANGGDSDHYQCSFWVCAQGAWKEVPQVLPALALKDFLTQAQQLPDARYSYVQLRFELPQKGTTIQVFPEPNSELAMGEILDNAGLQHDGFVWDKYEALIHSAYDHLDLAWDKTAGKFTVAKKVLRKP